MWSTPIDLYCERIDAGFWAEPVNAITNVAFLIAAAAAFMAWRRSGRDLFLLALILIAAVVGIGSFLFHTLATRGAVLLDVIPIAAFIYGYLWFGLMRFLRLRLPTALLIVAGFIALTQGLERVVPAGFLNGSWAYLPALAALLIVAAFTPGGPGRRLMLAAATFTISVVFRTTDLAVCPILPLGTHFLWHSLNGLVLYLLLRAGIARPQGNDRSA